MKKLQHVVLSFCLLLGLICYPNISASAASVSLGLSSQEINIGDTVTVSVTVPESITATIDLSFSSNILSFSSASADVNANGSTIRMNVGKYSLAAAKTVTVTFKATTSGSAGVSASVISAVDNSTAEEVSLDGASVVISVANQVQEPENTTTDTTTETPKSADNSLSALKISSGTLSPSFQYNVTNYTVTVPYDVEKIVVSATPSNSKAVIESVTGNGTVNLQVGKNTIQIVVVAENGVKVTYTVVVTRSEQEVSVDEPSQTDSEPEDTPEDETSEDENRENNENDMLFVFQWNGLGLNSAESIPEEVVLTDFTVDTTIINSLEMPCLTFANADMTVLYLMDEEGTADFYIYDEASQSVYPFVKLLSENGYIIVLHPEETNLPSMENYKACTLSIEGKGVISAYQFVSKEEDTTGWSLGEKFYAAEPSATDFYLIYAMNNLGETGWYLYDFTEGTYQRYSGSVLTSNENTQEVVENTQEQENEKLLAQLEQTQQKQMVILGISGVAVVVLLILVVSLILKNRSKSQDEFDEYEELEGYDVAAHEDADKEDVFGENKLKDAIEKLSQMTDESETMSDDVKSQMKIENEEDETDEVEVEFYEIEEETNHVEDEFYEMEDDTDDVEVEFYEIEDNTDDVEVEFYEMGDDTNDVEVACYEVKEESVGSKETKDATVESFEIEDEVKFLFDEVEIEPIEESEDKTEAEETDFIQEEKETSENLELEEDDDDLEFIDLD